MNFYLNVKNNKIINASNLPCTDEGITSIGVTETVYYNFIAHEDRYKFENNSIVEDADFITRFAAINQAGFLKEFFNTSLGYVRRKVSMATGETKDFLSDLLPSIAAGLQLNQTIQILTYSQPDYTQELTNEYLETLQSSHSATAVFVQECFARLAADFTGL